MEKAPNNAYRRATGLIPAVRTAGVKPAARWVFVSVALWLTFVPSDCFAQAEPPILGRPKDFSGLVGQYLLSVRARPTSVKLEEPITVTVTISALSEAASAPSLGNLHLLPDNIGDNFHVQPPERIVEKERAWELEYQLRPKLAGVQTLPSLKLVYYHPQRQKYQATYSEAIVFDVQPKESAAAPTLAELPESLFIVPSRTETLDRLLPPLALHRGLLMVMFAAPAALCLVWYCVWRLLHGGQVKRARKPRRITALESQLGGAASDPDALRTLLAEYLKLPVVSPTPSDVEQHLRRLGASRATQRACVELITACDSASYAPANRNGSLMERLRQVVQVLENEPCLRH